MASSTQQSDGNDASKSKNRGVFTGLKGLFTARSNRDSVVAEHNSTPLDTSRPAQTTITTSGSTGGYNSESLESTRLPALQRVISSSDDTKAKHMNNAVAEPKYPSHEAPSHRYAHSVSRISGTSSSNNNPKSSLSANNGNADTHIAPSRPNRSSTTPNMSTNHAPPHPPPVDMPVSVSANLSGQGTSKALQAPPHAPHGESYNSYSLSMNGQSNRQVQRTDEGLTTTPTPTATNTTDGDRQRSSKDFIQPAALAPAHVSSEIPEGRDKGVTAISSGVGHSSEGQGVESPHGKGASAEGPHACFSPEKNQGPMQKDSKAIRHHHAKSRGDMEMDGSPLHSGVHFSSRTEPTLTRQVSSEVDLEQTLPSARAKRDKKKNVKYNLSFRMGLLIKVFFIYFIGFLFCIGTMACVIIITTKERKFFLSYGASHEELEVVASTINPSFIIVSLACGCVLIYLITGVFLYTYTSRYGAMAQNKIEEYTHFFEMVQAWNLDSAPFYVNDTKGVSSDQLMRLQNLYINGDSSSGRNFSSPPPLSDGNTGNAALHNNAKETFTLLVYSKKRAEQEAELSLSIANIRLRHYKNRLVSLQMLMSSNQNASFLLFASSLANSFQPLQQFYQLRQQQQQQQQLQQRGDHEEEGRGDIRMHSQNISNPLLRSVYDMGSPPTNGPSSRIREQGESSQNVSPTTARQKVPPPLSVANSNAGGLIVNASGHDPVNRNTRNSAENNDNVLVDDNEISSVNSTFTNLQQLPDENEEDAQNQKTTTESAPSAPPFTFSHSPSRAGAVGHNSRYSTFSVGSSKSGTNRAAHPSIQAMNLTSPTSSMNFGPTDSVNHGVLPSTSGGVLNNDLDMLLMDDVPSGRGLSVGRSGRSGGDSSTSPRALQHSRPPRPNSVLASQNPYGERGAVNASNEGGGPVEQRNWNTTARQKERTVSDGVSDIVSIAPTNATAVVGNFTAVTHDGFVVPDKNAILRAYRKAQPIVMRDVTVLVASFSGFFDAMWFDQQYSRRISNLFLGIITEWAHYYGGMTIVSRPDRIYVVWNTSALPRPGNDHREIALACGRQLCESLGNAKLRRGDDGTTENNVLDGFFPVLVIYSGKLLTGTMGDTQLQRRLVVFGREIQVVNSVVPLLHVLRQAATGATGWMTKDAHQSLSIDLAITFVWMGKGENDPPPTKQCIPVDRIVDVQRSRERGRRSGVQSVSPSSDSRDSKSNASVTSEDVYVLYGLWPERQLSPMQMESMLIMKPAFQAFVKGEHEKAFQLYSKAIEIYPENPLATRLKLLAQHFALEQGPGYSRALPHWPVFGMEDRDDDMLEKEFKEIEMEIVDDKNQSDLSVDTPLSDIKKDSKFKSAEEAPREEKYKFPTSASGGEGSDGSPITSSPPGLPVIMVSSSSFSAVNAERQSRLKSYQFPDDSPFAARPVDANGKMSESPEVESESPIGTQEKPITSIFTGSSKFGASLLSPGCESARNTRGSRTQLTPAIVSPSMLDNQIDHEMEGSRTAKNGDSPREFASPFSEMTYLSPRTLASSANTAVGRESVFSRSPSAAPIATGHNTAEGSHSSATKPNISAVDTAPGGAVKESGGTNTLDPDLINLKDEKENPVEGHTSHNTSVSSMSSRQDDGRLSESPRKRNRVINATIVPPSTINEELYHGSLADIASQSGGSDSKFKLRSYNDFEEQQRRRSHLLRQKSIFCINPLSMPASPHRGNSLLQDEEFNSFGGVKKNTLSTDITDKQGLMFRLSQRVLGRGASGEVRLGLSHMGGLVAIKIVELVMASKSGDETPKEDTPSEGLSERAKAIQRRRLKRKGIPTQENVKETVNSLAAEIEILSRLRHSCIVGYIGAVIEESRLMLIMEYASGGSLQKVLDLFTDLSHIQGTGYLKDVLHGLVYLHSQQIVHRDVKPENVLVTSSGLCKLIDFGISKQMSVATRALQVDGTPFYMAPEAFTGNVTSKSDIWSFGIMLAVVYTRKLPWPPNNNPMSIRFQLSRNPNFRPELQGDLTPEEMEVFLACTQHDPDKRPTAHSILQMPLFKNYLAADKPTKQTKSPGKSGNLRSPQPGVVSSSTMATTPPSSHSRMNASNTGGSSNVRDSQLLNGGGTFSSIANGSNTQAKKKRAPVPYLLSTTGPFSTTTNTTNTTNNSNSTVMLMNGEDASLNNLLSQTQKNVMNSCSSYGNNFSSNVVEASAVSAQPFDSVNQLPVSPRVSSVRSRRQPTQSTAMKSIER